MLVGGGLSSVPRLARELGVFVRDDEALPVLRALLDAWQEDLRYRISRVKARLKFMVDDYGPEGMRAEVERRLGYALPDYDAPAASDREPADHLGVQAQKQRRPRRTLGVPVHLGLITGDQMIALADLADDARRRRRASPASRTSSSPASPRRARRRRARRSREIGFPLDANPLRGGSIGCTGEPHCNFAVTETKTRLDTASSSTSRRGSARRSPSSGCTSTAARTPAGSTGSAISASRGRPCATPTGKRRQAYEFYVRGALGPRRRDRPPALPPRADRGARRRPSSASSPAGSTHAATARVSGLRDRSTDDELGRRGYRPRAGQDAPRSRRHRGGGDEHVSVELFDELETGELAVEFEGAGAVGRPRVGDRALRRRGSRSRPPSRRATSR